jgi:hypothetical protein
VISDKDKDGMEDDGDEQSTVPQKKPAKTVLSLF